MRGKTVPRTRPSPRRATGNGPAWRCSPWRRQRSCPAVPAQKSCRRCRRRPARRRGRWQCRPPLAASPGHRWSYADVPCGTPLFFFYQKERPTRPPLHGLLFWSFFAYFLCKESRVILRRWYRLRYPLRPPGQAPPPQWLPVPQGSGQSRRYPRFSRSRLRRRGRHGRPRPPCHPRPGA